MINSRMYDLNDNQIIFYEDLKKICEDNWEYFVEQMIEFIRIKHNYNSASGKSNKAVIGISGGVDSALVAALAVRALGPDNVILVKMPYVGMSSKGSIEDSDLLAAQLGVNDIRESPINEIADAIIRAAEASGKKMSALGKGNAMARARMSVLYAIAGENDGRVLDTCNLTEVLVGFFTKHGDGASDLNPVGELYKTWVWILARKLGVPECILNKKPSAELEKGQTDENDMGITYRALDLVLYLLYKKNISVKAMIEEYYLTLEMINFVIKKVNASDHKRKLAPVCKLRINSLE